MPGVGDFISLNDAQKLCPYSADYLKLRARQGKLRAKKIGRIWVTKKEWLKHYEKKMAILKRERSKMIAKPRPDSSKISVSKKAKKKEKTAMVQKGKTKSGLPIVSTSFTLTALLALLVFFFSYAREQDPLDFRGILNQSVSCFEILSLETEKTAVRLSTQLNHYVKEAERFFVSISQRIFEDSLAFEKQLAGELIFYKQTTVSFVEQERRFLAVRFGSLAEFLTRAVDNLAESVFKFVWFEKQRFSNLKDSFIFGTEELAIQSDQLVDIFFYSLKARVGSVALKMRAPLNDLKTVGFKEIVNSTATIFGDYFQWLAHLAYRPVLATENSLVSFGRKLQTNFEKYADSLNVFVASMNFFLKDRVFEAKTMLVDGWDDYQTGGESFLRETGNFFRTSLTAAKIQALATGRKIISPFRYYFRSLKTDLAFWQKSLKEMNRLALDSYFFALERTDKKIEEWGGRLAKSHKSYNKVLAGDFNDFFKQSRLVVSMAKQRLAESNARVDLAWEKIIQKTFNFVVDYFDKMEKETFFWIEAMQKTEFVLIRTVDSFFFELTTDLNNLTAGLKDSLNDSVLLVISTFNRGLRQTSEGLAVYSERSTTFFDSALNLVFGYINNQFLVANWTVARYGYSLAEDLIVLKKEIWLGAVRFNQGLKGMRQEIEGYFVGLENDLFSFRNDSVSIFRKANQKLSILLDDYIFALIKEGFVFGKETREAGKSVLDNFKTAVIVFRLRLVSLVRPFSFWLGTVLQKIAAWEMALKEETGIWLLTINQEPAKINLRLKQTINRIANAMVERLEKTVSKVVGFSDELGRGLSGVETKIVSFFSKIDGGLNQLTGVFTRKFLGTEREKPIITSQNKDGMIVIPLGLKDEKLKERLKESFSDEVVIEPDESGDSGIIKPVFKNESDQEYFYILVPIMGD